MELTEKQKNVLEFVNAYIKLKGYAPSYMDIAIGLNLKSKSNIHRLVHELKKKGHLKIKPHLVRSLKVVDKSVNKMTAL
jgi:repressor LexA